MKQIIIDEYPYTRIKENYKEYEFINQLNEIYKKGERQARSRHKLVESIKKSVGMDTPEKKVEPEDGRVIRITTPPIKPFLLADDFKTDIKDRITLDVKRESDYPIFGNVSIYADYYTNRELSCIGVYKNIQDALLGKIISDDKLVKSLIVERHNAGSAEEALLLNVITTREFLNIDDMVEKYKPYVKYTKEITTTLEDRYQVYPKNIDIKEVAHLNQSYDEVLVRKIKELYQGPVCDDHEIKVSVQITTYDSNSDCDNVAMNYLYCSQGILFRDIRQIKKLHVMKKITDKEKPSIVIEWE
jgi:Holliday junction resolvase RusA-like endonuclease